MSEDWLDALARKSVEARTPRRTVLKGIAVGLVSTIVGQWIPRRKIQAAAAATLACEGVINWTPEAPPVPPPCTIDRAITGSCQDFATQAGIGVLCSDGDPFPGRVGCTVATFETLASPTKLDKPRGYRRKGQPGWCVKGTVHAEWRDPSPQIRFLDYQPSGTFCCDAECRANIAAYRLAICAHEQEHVADNYGLITAARAEWNSRVVDSFAVNRSCLAPSKKQAENEFDSILTKAIVNYETELLCQFDLRDQQPGHPTFGPSCAICAPPAFCQVCDHDTGQCVPGLCPPCQTCDPSTGECVAQCAPNEACVLGECVAVCEPGCLACPDQNEQYTCCCAQSGDTCIMINGEAACCFAGKHDPSVCEACEGPLPQVCCCSNECETCPPP